MTTCGIQLLLLEDDHDDAVIIQDLVDQIEEWRITIDWAQTIEAAMARAKRRIFDLYIVDYHLRGKTGIDFIRAMRGKGVDTPMIMLTGTKDPRIDRRAAAAGANDYLQKGGLTLKVLARSIRDNLNRDRGLRAISRPGPHRGTSKRPPVPSSRA